MSHELRTPLSIIMGYHDLLLEEVFGPMGPDQVESELGGGSTFRVRLPSGAPAEVP
jgi:signal transduction histidine kinase